MVSPGKTLFTDVGVTAATTGDDGPARRPATGVADERAGRRKAAIVHTTAIPPR